MASERLSSAIIPGLIVCLSLGALLLGVQFSDSLGSADQLSPAQSAVLVGATVLLYAAVSWRGTAGTGLGPATRWWATMLSAHAGLGLATGAAETVLAPGAPQPLDIARWAAGASLPVAVLQVGYSIGVVALAWGREAPSSAPAVSPKPSAAAVAPPIRPVEAAAREAGSREAQAARLGIYAKAVEQVRAQDASGVLRFAVQAAQCEAGLLATRDGLLVATEGGSTLDPTAAAAILAGLVRDLEGLGSPAGGSPVLLHAALGGFEVLAMPGHTLVGCLMGPKPGAREVAEVVLPALVARAESLPGSGNTAG